MWQVNRAPIARCTASALLCGLILGACIAFVALYGQRWQAALAVGLALGAIPAGLLWKHRASRIQSRQVRFDVDG